MGDLHYENIDRDEPGEYRAAFDQVLSAPGQAALYREVPIVYVWDDHDFGADDADGTNPGRPAARAVYQEVVPHYPLAAGVGDVPIYQSFSVGRARFLVTDSRSERTPSSEPDDGDKTVLGSVQREWLERELLAALEGHEVVFLVSSLPWIAAAKPKADDWGGYPTEREELAQFIREHDLPPVIMLSGDAHMLAIDDGSNNTYGGGGRGFPVFHAATLDKHGSIKGGPYSHGAIKGRGHFGLVEVRDDGDEISVVLTGRDAQDRVLLAYRFRGR